MIIMQTEYGPVAEYEIPPDVLDVLMFFPRDRFGNWDLEDQKDEAVIEAFRVVREFAKSRGPRLDGATNASDV